MYNKYICPSCGQHMVFEDELEYFLVCLSCGDSVELDHYGLTDEEYEAQYPTEDEFYDGSEIDDEDEDDCGEYYEEVYDELDRD